MNRWFYGVFFGLVVLLAAVAVMNWRQRNERDTWQQSVASAKERLRERREAVSTAAAARRVEPPVTPTPATAATRAAPATPRVAPNPEHARVVAAERKRAARLNALTSYAAGFQALALPVETVARAKEIILAHAEAAAESAAKAREGGRSMDAAFAAARLARREMEAQLSALLGPATYEQLAAYEREDRFDWTMGTDLWDGGVPLTAGQLHALALATVQTQFEPGNIAIAPTPTQVPDLIIGLSSQDHLLLAASARFLSAPQQSILRQHLIDDNRYHAAMRAFAARQRELWKSAQPRP